eukprot:1507294-Prymnesium_polylepis.2
MVPTVQAAPCPTCSDCLPGCTFSADARACPFLASVAANSAGVGALNEHCGFIEAAFQHEASCP